MQSSLQASTAASARAVCQHTGGVDRARLIPRSSLWNKRIRTQCMHRPQFRTHIIAMAGQNGGSSEQALVIGAGIAGLSCGLKLQKAGIPFTILESSDGPGGRVRSDKVEGFTLDRGFQIFLTSYPEAKEVLDYADLDLKPFYAGAYVHYKNQFHKVADPLRHPLDGVQSLFNSTGTIGDKLNVGAFRLKSELGSLEDLLQRDETTTMERLKVLHDCCRLHHANATLALASNPASVQTCRGCLTTHEVQCHAKPPLICLLSLSLCIMHCTAGAFFVMQHLH